MLATLTAQAKQSHQGSQAQSCQGTSIMAITSLWQAVVVDS